MINHNTQKKIAVINDLTGFGRCALTVAIPIISRLKIQCCPVPTAILSNHTAFESWFMDDFTDRLGAYTAEWKKLSLTFNGIATGFLGSAAQFRTVERFLEDFRTEDTIVLVDPVMGDHGKIYKSYNEEMCAAMRELAKRADILTPNLTEACVLTGIPWHEGKWKRCELDELLAALLELGPKKVVITGIPQGEFVANLCAFPGEKLSKGQGTTEVLTRQYRVGATRSGTGDVFSAILIGDAVNALPFEESVRRASRFIRKCLLRSMEMNIPVTDGVCFEEVLDQL